MRCCAPRDRFGRWSGCAWSPSIVAAEFLAPAAEIIDDLPRRPDWVRLHDLKRRWGVSLKALVVRAHHLGKFTDHTYRRALRQLATWGLPEPGPLGAPEAPVVLPRAVELLGGPAALATVAGDTGLPVSEVHRVWTAAGGQETRPAVTLTGED
ncbi:MAG: ImmA/IrrE family metallo-endopeptidase [Actinomycetota bacterium]|nr:ImmA/IrrE family metallo-endopeptidase [Actinomycetota bacterium]